MRSTAWPSRKIRTVGIERIPCAAADSGFWSMSSLATSARPANWSAIASIVDARARQGGHHGAQKSTRTGRSPRLMVSWNVASSISRTYLVNMVWRPQWGGGAESPPVAGLSIQLRHQFDARTRGVLTCQPPRGSSSFRAPTRCFPGPG